ncbi:uncharacterized protein NESG_00749 [Nematocida ausubeli]|uniref:Uncharacterized protein n=1 Tax=Nematocida ausubeli (strain ATCC PRA-371 / ERTm2) TaxID=1913371 RepID=A0A086J380_NEMA1|nr:uncharacterized protein NESG_00749 [Nematocida ausubeli]KFG26598.1 hypothetical protein NESG_00749 [Nematocida ausubeli]
MPYKKLQEKLAKWKKVLMEEGFFKKEACLIPKDTAQPIPLDQGVYTILALHSLLSIVFIVFIVHNIKKLFYARARRIKLEEFAEINRKREELRRNSAQTQGPCHQ